MLAPTLLSALLLVSSTLAHPSPFPNQNESTQVIGRANSNATTAGDFDVLYNGNKVFRAADPALLQKLADDGQAPAFMFLGCSDSRVSEGTVFNAKPGTLFTERNVANQYSSLDTNARTIVAYAVDELHVKHIIVMGHYGCGGVAGAIASPPPLPWGTATITLQNWIAPIREVYRTSKRAEVVAMREKNKGLTNVPAPKLRDPGFRALVEENVKNTVSRIASDKIISEYYSRPSKRSESTSPEAGGSPGDLFIHGWVYNIENGEIKNLGVSVGPPGKKIPPIPFGNVVSVVQEIAGKHA